MSEKQEQRKANESLVPQLREKLVKFQKEQNLDETELQLLCEKNDDGLRRFLIARDNNLKKAFKMASAALVWRNEVHPSDLTVTDFETANAQGVWRFAGYAKNGWPIFLVSARLWDPSKYSVDEYVKMVAFFIETNIRRMDPSKKGGRNFIIFDMKGLSYFKSDLRMLRQLAKLTADYYPERLGVGVVLHADMVFFTFFKILAAMVDKETSGKAQIFRSDYGAYLEDQIGLENVSADLGGTRSEEWPALTKENQDVFRWEGPPNAGSK